MKLGGVTMLQLRAQLVARKATHTTATYEYSAEVVTVTLSMAISGPEALECIWGKLIYKK